MCRDGKIRMDGPPMAKEGLIVDVIEFLEKDRDFYAGLEIWLRIIAELRMGEGMLDFVERHCRSSDPNVVGIWGLVFHVASFPIFI